MLDHLLPLLYRESAHLDEAEKENWGYAMRRRSRPVSSSVAAAVRTPPRPPRRRSVSSSRVEGGVASRKRPRGAADDGSEERGGAKKQEKETPTHETKDRRRLKRPREAADDGEQRDAKRQQVDRDEEEAAVAVAVEETEQTETSGHKDKSVGRSLKRQREASDGEERRQAKKQVVDREEKQVADEKKEALVESKEEKQVADIRKEEEVVTPEKQTQTPIISAKKETKIKKVQHEKKPDEKVARKRIPLQDITHLYVNERTRSYEQQQRDRFVAGLSTSVAIRFF